MSQPRPRTPTEQTVFELWTELLGEEPPDADADFFISGGHSLLAMRLGARLREAFDVEVPLPVLFEAPTVAGQASFIDRAHQAARVPPPQAEIPPRDRLPLSFAQERMWFFEQLAPGTAVNHLVRILRLEGELDRSRLDRSFVTVAARHEALRTVFYAENGVPWQRVLAEPQHERAEEDLSELDAAAQAKAIEQATAAEMASDLMSGSAPLWRTRLLRLGPRTHVLMVVGHHLIVDAWSFNVWLQELASHYRASSEGSPPSLVLLPLQPADLARAERRGSAELEGSLAFFKAMLAGAPPAVTLPTDRPRPLKSSFAGGQVNIGIESGAVVRLEELARAEGCTLFMVLLAALGVLLSRLSGQEDLVIGTPVAGRDRREVEKLIGLFMNLVPLRIDLSGAPSARELLARVREIARGALAHADVSYERVLAELGESRESGKNPFFDVLLNLLPPSVPLDLPGLEVSMLQGRHDAGAVDLFFTFARRADGALAGTIRYARDLYDEPTVLRIAERYRMLLEELPRDAQRSIRSLPLMPSAERHTILSDGNGTEVARAGCGVHALIEAWADATPDAIAFAHAGATLSFRELDRRANRIAHALLERGLDPEAIVGVCLGRSFDLPAAVLAVLKAGGTFVPIDPVYSDERIARMIEHSQPSVILTDAALVPRLPAGCEILRVREALGKTEARPMLPVRGDQRAYVLYTSGSTGEPKGAVVSHAGLENRISWLAEQFPWKHGEVCCQKTPLGFVDSIWELLGPAAGGVRCVIPSDDEAADPARLARLLADTGVTRLMLVPTLLRTLLLLAPGRTEWLPRLELWMVGGDALTSELADRFLARRPDARLVNLYGASEASAEVTWHEVQAGELGPLVPIGRPIANARVYVLDEAREPVPPGVVGELYIGGAGVASAEYFRAPDLTAERFSNNPFQAGERIYRSGDRARFRNDGSLELLGRAGSEIKVHGVRVAPVEIEALLHSHPSIDDAVVGADRAPNGDVRLVAWVTFAPDAPPVSSRELKRFLRGRLPEALMPAALVSLSALPLSPSGKVDRTLLPSPDASVADEDAGGPHTSFEDAIAGLWEELLGRRAIDIDDDFFRLGGHSLLVALLAARIRESFGAAIPFASLFEHSTVRAQAALVADARQAGHDRLVATGGTASPDRDPKTGRQASPLVRVERREHMPLSPAQERLFLIERLAPESRMHRVHVATRIDGALDRARLEGAIDTIARRHEALRTRFGVERGVAWQQVDAELPRDHRFVDLSSLDPLEAEAEAMRRSLEQKVLLFELERGPAWRTQLLRLAPERHVLLVTLHHLIVDAWSLRLWFEELGAHYAGRMLAQPQVQPVDVAVWQQKQLAEHALEKSCAYWREQLRGAVRAELPADAPWSAQLSYASEFVQRELPPEDENALRSLARGEGVTLFSALLAIFAVIIGRVAETKDVIVGTPVAGRERPELRGLIGLFLNTLPLRIDLSGAPTFRDLLHRARAVAQRALANGDVPFDRIVAELDPPRQGWRNPFFDVVLNAQPPSTPPELPGLVLTPLYRATSAETMFDLMLRIFEQQNRLHFRLEYRRARFSAARMEALLDRYLLLLSIAAGDPDRCADETS